MHPHHRYIRRGVPWSLENENLTSSDPTKGVSYEREWEVEMMVAQSEVLTNVIGLGFYDDHTPKLPEVTLHAPLPVISRSPTEFPKIVVERCVAVRLTSGVDYRGPWYVAFRLCIKLVNVVLVQNYRCIV